jgi:hypothetical protein
MRGYLSPRSAVVVVAGALAIAFGCSPASDADSCGAACDVADADRFDPTAGYPDRLRILERLAQEHPFPFAQSDDFVDGDDSSRDRMAGIYFQSKWQMTSGRDLRGDDGRLWSFWPNVNWTLTVWQLEALRSRGELPQVEVATYDDPRFVMPDDVRDKILAYYDEVDRLRAAVASGDIPAAGTIETEHKLQRLLWDFHRLALKVAIPRNQDVLEALPEGERRFASAWGLTIVEMLGVINFPTTEPFAVKLQQAALPQRLVDADDLSIASASDLPALVRAGVVGVVSIHDLEQLRGGALLVALKAAARLLSQGALADGFLLALGSAENAAAALLDLI